MDLNLRFVAPAFSLTGCDRYRANVAERVTTALFVFSFQYLVQARTKRAGRCATRAAGWVADGGCV